MRTGRILLAATVLASAAIAAAEEPSWPWPGPTPPKIVDAMMKKSGYRRPNARELKQMADALPEQPPATPARPRKVLCWGRLWTHPGNGFAEETVKLLGRRTKAFEVVASDDPRLLLPESLKGFDAIFLNGLHDRQPFLPPNFASLSPKEQAAAKELDRKVKQSLLKFVKEDGKGIAGIEGSICALRDWKEFGQMMGAFYNGHYWGDHVIKVEDPTHPVAACLAGKQWRLRDQIYAPGRPYSRKNLRVLLSVDLTQLKDPGDKTPVPWLSKATAKRDDYPISWVRKHGRGRVFYCSLGVNIKTYLDPLFLRYLLAGIQFAIGDLPGDTTPSEPSDGTVATSSAARYDRTQFMRENPCPTRPVAIRACRFRQASDG